MGELDQNDPCADLAVTAGGVQDTAAKAVAPASAVVTQPHALLGGQPQAVSTVILGRGGLFQEGLTSILSGTDFRLVASVCTAEETALSFFQDQPLLLIVDAGDDLNLAASQIECFKQRFPTARVAVLTDADQINNLLLLFRAGAHACFARGVTRDVLLKSLELVVLGENFLLPGVLPLVRDSQENASASGAASNKGATLSAQEKCVLRCLAEGHSNKVIANKINIAVATVKVHVNSIFRKIGTSNRTQAAIWARNNISQDEPAEDRPSWSESASGASADGAVVSPSVAPPSFVPSSVVPLKPYEIAQPVKERPSRPTHAVRSLCDSKPDSLTQTGLRRCSQEEELDRRAQRRVAEQQERHAEFVAKTNHLRELRKAREAAERQAVECPTAKLSTEPDPMQALLPLNPSSGSAEERGSQQSGIRLA
ncbi:MAG: response regulator transcription factor [Hyphomicrobiales bacterium]|nr:response regulator transcription factor [Hyphomicrobiales bacterium]